MVISSPPRPQRAARSSSRPGRPEWFAAAALLATLAGTHSDYRPAVLWRERIARAPVEGDAEAARLLALIAAARRLFQMGDYDAAEEAISFVESERRELGESCADPRVDAELSRLLGARARHAGDVASDLEHYRAALAAYERAGDLRGTCNALVSVGFGYIQIGDYALARQHLEHALADAQRIDLAPVVTRALQNLALVAFAEGRLDDARSMATVVIDQAEQRGDRRFAAWTRIYLSRIECAAGDFERALAEADRALGVLAGTPPAYAGVLAVKALTHLERRPGGRDAVSGGPPGWSSSKNIERRPGGRDAVSGGPPGWSSSKNIERRREEGTVSGGPHAGRPRTSRATPGGRTRRLRRPAGLELEQ
ncbi:MAG: hypothetical protein U0271_02985 [Polyangiaceae bacterium]